jgi:hypothetical protein
MRFLLQILLSGASLQATPNEFVFSNLPVNNSQWVGFNWWYHGFFMLLAVNFEISASRNSKGAWLALFHVNVLDQYVRSVPSPPLGHHISYLPEGIRHPNFSAISSVLCDQTFESFHMLASRVHNPPLGPGEQSFETTDSMQEIKSPRRSPSSPRMMWVSVIQRWANRTKVNPKKVSPPTKLAIGGARKKGQTENQSASGEVEGSGIRRWEGKV